MEKQIQTNISSEVTKECQFDLSIAFAQIATQTHFDSQEQVNLSKALISDLKINARQKLKHYKKILESGEKQNLNKQKEFINKHLKKVFLQEYLIGNTQNKPSLLTLLKKLQIITFADIIKVSKNVSIKQFQQIKVWSEMIDLVFKEFSQQITAEQYQGVNNILNLLDQLMFEGRQMIEKNEFKSKWLGTFTEILRTQNILCRVFIKFIPLQKKLNILETVRSMIAKASFLSKQVITQLFLLLIFLSPQESQPSQQNHLCLIHYYHAQSVVKGLSNIKQLINLVPKLKQTEHKCQLLPLLEQSFLQYYAKLTSQEDKQFKNNVFDQVINLFEVGRSIYGYLQTIVKIIIESGDHWNMEGNFVRKFFIATIVLKLLPSKSIILQWPTIVQDVIEQCGGMSIPYAYDCAKILFEKLYEENQKNYEKWVELWIHSYKSKLLNFNDRGSIRGIIDFINPILLKICSKPFLLKELLALTEKQSNSNLQLGVISLIRCYKEIGQIEVNELDQTFQHSLDKTIIFPYNKIRNFLLSNDQMIAVQALELVSSSLKPSEPIKPMQFKLCLEFYKCSLKTSLPQFRKNYLGVTKKLFERLRNIYENLLTSINGEKKGPKKLYYTQFVDFLKSIVNICFKNVFPEAIFQLVNPALQILQLIQNYFGSRKLQVKKGIILQPTLILKETSFFDFCNFENLLSCLQSSYQSVRQLAHDLLNLFDEITKKQLLMELWQTSLKNTNKLAIRSFEYACRILTYISQIYPEILNIQQKYSLIQLNVLNHFLNVTKQRYIIFKEQFIKQGSNYYKNLIHGLLTIFSYQLDKLAEKMSNSENYRAKYAAANEQIKAFLNQFFTQLISMLNFAVQISSSNVSTVVLDTLNQGSQTDKKLRVDCRGHFLSQGSSIGAFLESTALISSMQDDEEGIQNTLVVSFYLLTRQAGLVFQSIGGLLSNQNSKDYIPSQNLIRLINTYFYALINLKHMGSVDRISKGLGKMSRIIFDQQSKQLSELPEILLNKVLNHLKDGNFTNILRRSAGVPFAFCCLLKSSSVKRNKLIEASITDLLSLSRQNKQTPIELRIHALNIMKKLFQDSDLKGDLDPYVSDAFISSIKGFTSEQWGVRNSSLMLFTALSNRTVGVRPTYNLLQFFIKCPALLQFIQTQLFNFSEAALNTMYPPLYPIVLLFSRLLPFDLKQNSKIIPQNSMKHIRKQQLLSLLPTFDKAGLNDNYMGRVMTAKAILPFMQIGQIQKYCVQGIQALPQYFNIDNNMLHYQLTKYNHLLTSYNEICKNSMRNMQIQKQILQKLWNFMDYYFETISKLSCPVVLQCFIKIFHYFFQNYNNQMVDQFRENYSQVIDKLCGSLQVLTNKYVFQTQRLVIQGDLGHSMMRKQAVLFELDIFIRYTNKFENFKNLAVKFTEFLSTKLQENQAFFESSDNEICEFYLQRILQNIKILKQEQKIELFKSMTHMLKKLDLNKIRSDIIISMVLELRISIKYKSFKHQEQVKFLLALQKQSNNHFLQIAIFKYLDYVKLNEEELLKLLMKFSDPNSLQQLRECVVEYLQTLAEYNPKLNTVCIRLLQDEEYEIRKQTTRILSTQMKIYKYNQTVIKNKILSQIQINDLSQLIVDNSDFKIKRKNNDQQRIFSYDKPNKFRSDISTLFEMLLTNNNLLSDNNKINQLASIFQRSLNQSQKQLNIVQKYKNDIIGRTQYQFELVLRQFISNLKSNKLTPQQISNISNFHPLFAQLINKCQNLIKK